MSRGVAFLFVTSRPMLILFYILLNPLYNLLYAFLYSTFSVSIVLSTFLSICTTIYSAYNLKLYSSCAVIIV